MRSVKISDFGISHFSLPLHDRAVLGKKGDKEKDMELNSMAGTPAFMAPELHPMCVHTELSHPFMPADSSEPPSGCFPTKALDVFALGVTLYAMLFGRLPWKGQRAAEIFNSICFDDWPAPPSYGIELLPCTRYPTEKDKSEGAVLMRLLGRLLEKHPSKRMTLDQLKVSV